MPFLALGGLLCPSLLSSPPSLKGSLSSPGAGYFLVSFRHTSQVRFKHSEYPVFGFVCGEVFLKLPAPNFKAQQVTKANQIQSKSSL